MNNNLNNSICTPTTNEKTILNCKHISECSKEKIISTTLFQSNHTKPKLTSAKIKMKLNEYKLSQQYQEHYDDAEYLDLTQSKNEECDEKKREYQNLEHQKKISLFQLTKEMMKSSNY